MGRYTTDVCSGLTVLAFGLKEVQEDRVIVHVMSVAWAFVADGHSSIDCVNQPGVKSSLYRPSVIPRLGAGIMSFIAAGMCSVPVLENVH